MASAATETSPLLPIASAPTTPVSESRPRPPRTVTFNPNPVTKTIDPEPEYQHPRASTRSHHHAMASPSSISTGGLGGVSGGPPMLSALNSKLRRRSSHGHSGSITAVGGGGSSTATGATGGGGTGTATALLGTAALASSSLVPSGPPPPKIGPQRSSKTAQKLKLLPNPEEAPGAAGAAAGALGDAEDDEDDGARDVYSQYARIKDPMARRDARRLGKADRARLPRVTAYCTANKYQMEGLMRFLKSRGRGRGANPKLIDECIYTPYSYESGVKQVKQGTPVLPAPELQQQLRQQEQERESASQSQEARLTPASIYERRHSTGEIVGNGDGTSSYQAEDLIDLESGEGGDSRLLDLGSNLQDGIGGDALGRPRAGEGNTALEDSPLDFDIQVHTPEVFLFNYGVVVIWGMTALQEQRFLKELAKFETEKLAPDDVEAEYFNFYYTREYQARIYNDFITLRDKTNYMTKLAISHALAQSVKTSLFEELIASTIDTCKDVPTQIALTGKIALSRTQINMQIGELFILRINIHLNGSVLDTPELFWVEPQLEPVYQAVRSYLEMDQRVGLLTERLDVIADLLAVLKDQLSHGHGEKLEWIVIVLIAAEILVAAVNIVVDLYAGGD